MMTNRMHVAAIAAALLLSFSAQAMKPAVGLVRAAAKHPKMTAATVAAFGLGVYAYNKWHKNPGADKLPDLMGSAVPVQNDGQLLTDSQNAQLAKQDKMARWYNPMRWVVNNTQSTAQASAPWLAWAANRIATGATAVYNSPTTATVATFAKDKAVAGWNLGTAALGDLAHRGWVKAQVWKRTEQYPAAAPHQ